MKNLTFLAKASLCLLTLSMTIASAKPPANKSIYGEDNRVDTINHPSQDFQELGASVAIQIADSKWIYSEDKSLAIISERATLDEQLGGLCADEPFGDQIAPGSCTGFLVAPDVLVTAGHCVKTEDDCKNSSWFFGFYNGINAFSKNDVYWCTQIIAQKYVYDEFEKADYAIIRLNRSSERAPLQIRTEGKVKVGTPLVMIGHPSGLPQKITDNAVVTEFNNSEREDIGLALKLRKDFFMTNLDAFGGNSGSPVFNAETGVVEGILVKGRNDWVKNGSCTQSAVYEDDDLVAAEQVLRITKLPL